MSSVQYTWDEVNNCFAIQCHCPNPSCNSPIVEPETSHILSKCWDCGTVIEWIAHQRVNQNTPTYWPRLGSSHFSSLTGQRFIQQSHLDWSESGGAPTRNGYASDPHQVLFGQADRANSFRLNELWTCTNIGSKLKKLQSLNINHRQLILTNTEGRVFVYSDALTSEPPKLLQELPWPASPIVKQDSLSSPSISYPHICLHSKSEIVVWTCDLQTSTISKQIFHLQSDEFEFLSSPICITHEGKKAFVCWESNKSKFKDSNLRILIQKVPDGQFESICISTNALNVAPVLAQTKEPKIVCISKTGLEIIEIPVDSLWDATPKQFTIHVESAIKPNLGKSKFPTFVSTLNHKGQAQYWVANVHPRTNEIYISNIILSPNGETNRWKTFKIGRQTRKIWGLSVGSPGTNYNGDSNIANLISVNTEDGIYLNSKQGNSNLTTDIISPDHFDNFRGSQDQTIMTSVGVITRTGSRLQLNWESSNWGGQSSKKADFSQFNSRLYCPGIAYSSGCIFVSDFIGDYASVKAIQIEKI
jgi:hypothetical protein